MRAPHIRSVAAHALATLGLLVPIALASARASAQTTPPPATPSAPPAAAPAGPPPAVTQAQAFLRDGKLDSAIAVLEPFLATTPAAPGARLLLGDAYRRRGDPDRAVATYLQVRQPLALRLSARYRAAGIEASRGRVGAAFALIDTLRASGAFDMDLVLDSAAFAPLKADARFARIAFRPDEFTNPFVEPVRIIHEWVAERKGDQYSWIARGIGDADGDGVGDLTTSAPTYGNDASPSAPGRVYTYSGKSGRLLWQATGEGRGQLGFGIEGAGDVNGDGAGDVIAGAPFTNRVIVYSGRDGRVIHTLAPPATAQGAVPPAGPTGERFGNSVASAGDQDGDGAADVIVGAPGSNATGQGAGRAYVFSGRTGALLHTLDGERAGDGFGTTVSGAKTGKRTPIVVSAASGGPAQRGRVYLFDAGATTPRFAVDADSTGAALGGGFVSLVGDVDGDKVLDLYASDFPNAARGPSTGRAYVWSGASGRLLRTFTGERPGDGFGIGSADLGDIDKDGFDDLVIGAWQHASAAPSGGKIYVYSGKDGALLRSFTGRIPGETLGFDAAGVGDLDGDGTVDLLVTSSWSNIRGYRSGRMFVISGR